MLTNGLILKTGDIVLARRFQSDDELPFNEDFRLALCTHRTAGEISVLYYDGTVERCRPEQLEIKSDGKERIQNINDKDKMTTLLDILFKMAGVI